MSHEEKIATLEGSLQQLIRDWERFFAGDLRVPPHNKSEQLSRRLRVIAEQPMKRSADRFRLEQLQHRFMTYSQNWERMLREREEGRGRSVGMLRARRSPPPPPPNASPPSSVDRPETEGLYDRYVAAKQEHGHEVTVDRSAFEAQIAAEREKLESRLGQKVRFEVLVEDGKVKLAARKIRKR